MKKMFRMIRKVVDEYDYVDLRRLIGLFSCFYYKLRNSLSYFFYFFYKVKNVPMKYKKIIEIDKKIR